MLYIFSKYHHMKSNLLYATAIIWVQTEEFFIVYYLYTVVNDIEEQQTVFITFIAKQNYYWCISLYEEALTNLFYI